MKFFKGISSEVTRNKIIVDPISSRWPGEDAIPMADYVLRGYGLDLNLVRIESQGHAVELVRQACEVEDGLLDICMAEHVSRPRIFALILRLL